MVRNVKKRLMTAFMGFWLLALTAAGCGTLAGATVGGAAGAGIGAATGSNIGKSAAIGAGVGGAAGAAYDIWDYSRRRN
jgi:hypothetical protein